ncbi:MAG: hypothetical protein U0K37_04590 [Acutalibacteraceae bacterium]|jgi:hypothetical protein|nr:hypothetical protein [Acutalibacteraceae bacterium]
MGVGQTLDALKAVAKNDPEKRAALLATRDMKNAVTEFCRLSTEYGCPLNAMDLIDYGESSYAAMRRSTNGGGENSPLLFYEDDAYEIFLAELRELDDSEA